MPRVLNANINSGFVDLKNFPGATRGSMRTETSDRYRYRGVPHVPPVDKTAHLKMDELKKYVERALQLHDARGGMAVVASPIWAPAK